MNGKLIVEQKFTKPSELIVKKNGPFANAGKRIKKSKYLILMIIPAVIYYLVFCYAPMYGILVAFKDYLPSKGILGSPWADLYGLANFEYIFDDEFFWRALANTLFIGSCKIVISFVMSILVALLINEIRMRHFKKTVQIIVTFPHFLSWVIVGGLVANIFASTGIVNNIIAAMGGDRIRFMGDGKFFLGLIFTSDVWKEAGWSSIIYLATMAGISPELYEAADIDGATRLQKIFHITLPSIKSTAILLLILSVGGVLSAGFDQILNMYNRLVYDTADILDTYIYRTTLGDEDASAQLDVGAAVGLFKSVVSFILVLIVDRIAKLCGERGII